MHAHERTLLTQLGFADPDKKERRHDLASRYLSLPAVADRLGDLVSPALARSEAQWLQEIEAKSGIPADEVAQFCSKHPFKFSYKRAVAEFHITKGEDRFRTTIGFADLILEWGAHCCSYQEYPPRMSAYIKGFRALVEIKIKALPTTEIIRQIRLYNEYQHSPYGAPRWESVIVVTAFPITAQEERQLTDVAIHHCLLGKGFEAYCESEENAADAVPSLVL